ncbi:grasp-with-spasm system ATP-grasp peptide maturase [Epilithonimonas hominis]|uniref:grasp-with-spasm system ATP-grasp peptide maturase n=1 Tax=Epilithonimonas hominis TaxID=420404 RepID=UPI0028A0AEB4|nr:grasp-with-spasm system ATP-grasp peptide maturase [Epilithonimonas hominis]
MILILSREIEESLTCRVIDYLESYNANYFRINGEDLFNKKVIFEYVLNRETATWELNIKTNDRHINSKDIKCVWFRRNFFQLSDLNDHPVINDFLKSELNILYSTFETIISNAFWLNKPSDRRVNKLFMLQKACENGLQTPKSYITNHKNGFENIKDDIITKPISESFSIVENGIRKTAFTAQVDESILNAEKYSDFFFPSFFQQKLEKEYEIRSFYLCGEIYSIAIFSQNDSRTQLDFRQYNEAKPNRNSKYQLPEEVEESIRNFMISININCGSIDLVKTRDSKFFFLELNPVGQIGVVSRFGHYNLERLIALKLIENDK